MNKTRARLLSFALALLLLLSAVPFVALADEEVEPAAACSHSYSPMDSSRITKKISEKEHGTYDVTTKMCTLCGHTTSESSLISKGYHSAMLGSRVLLSSYLGNNGELICIYQFTCSICNDTYKVTEINE